MQIELLTNASHLLGTFHCSNESIDDYFQSKALNDVDAVTHCFIDDKSKAIIALASLSCNGIMIKSGKLLHTVPAVEIKMFAVNDCYKSKSCPIEEGYHWSDYCFDKTISIISEFTDTYFGASRVFLYSVPKAVGFYKRQKMDEFTELMYKDDKMYLDGCTPMFMSL